MAPGTRRANRGGYAEHDDFEGLPVRQWRQDWVTVAPPEQQEQQQQNDIWAIELIHGMPKDATLLPLHTQELLRAARSGRLYKRPPPPEEEDAEAEAAPEKQEKKEEETVATGFSVKLWKQLPRSSEDTGLSHLAKRRKGTITIASKTVLEKAVGPTVTRATVRRIDAAGNPYTEDVTLADGQQVQGEIISTRVEAAPIGQPETFQHAPPPPPARKRAPPPKRKRAGPGRGKKKAKIPLPGAVQPAGVLTDANGLSAPKPNGLPNDTQSASEAPTNHDSEMADGDENDEDDDDDDEGDEGDEGEEGEGEDTPSVQHRDSAPADEGPHLDKEMKDAAPAVEVPESKEQMDVEMEDATSAPAHVDLPKPPALASALVEASISSPKLEGSPLKNEVLPPKSKSADEATQAVVATDDAPTEPPKDQAEHNDQKQETEESQHAPASVVDSLPEPKEATPEARVGPSTDALLPPPPDQVGNISSPNASPKDESAPDHSSLSGDKAHDDEDRGGEDLSDKPTHEHSDLMSVDDPIKPEDSVSMGVPRTESGAPSEAATGSVGGTTEPDLKAEHPSAPSPEKALEQSSEQSSEQPLEQLPEQPSEQIVDQPLEEPSTQSAVQASEESLEQLPDQPSEQPQSASDLPAEALEASAEETPQISQPAQEESDLLDGLMGELDREASKTAAAGAESAAPTPVEKVPEPASEAVLAEETVLKLATPDKELKTEPESETKVEATEEPLSEVKEVKEEPKDVSAEAPLEETASAESHTEAPAGPVDEN